MSLKVSGVRQHQVSKRNGFRLKSIGNNNEGNLVLTVLVTIIEHLAHTGGIHARIPGHIGHEQHQGVDLVGVTPPGVGNSVLHHAVNRQGKLP